MHNRVRPTVSFKIVRRFFHNLAAAGKKKPGNPGCNLMDV
jgi:hypothetical protein